MYWGSVKAFRARLLRLVGGSRSSTERVASPEGLRAINQAVALKPDAIVLGSVDAQEEAKAIRAAAQQGIKIVADVSASTGPVQDPPIFTNVTTDAVNVAKVAAAGLLQTTNCTAGAVIFWQSGDAIGIKKAETMRDVIQAYRLRTPRLCEHPFGRYGGADAPEHNLAATAIWKGLDDWTGHQRPAPGSRISRASQHWGPALRSTHLYLRRRRQRGSL